MSKAAPHNTVPHKHNKPALSESALPWLALSLIIFIADQITKYYANTLLDLHVPNAIWPSFNLTLVYNKGAAFSFLSDASGWQRWFFIVLGTIIAVVIIKWLRDLPRHEKWYAMALALVLGGAFGNVCDRIFIGYVIDFIDVYYAGYHWPVFNIADSAISVGAVMLVVDVIKKWGKDSK